MEEDPAPKGKFVENAVAMWDFRCSAVDLDYEDVISQLRKIAKKYVFQLERGSETGYLHYQGRISLIKKHRKGELLRLFTMMPAPNYLAPTVNANFYKGDMFYVTKAETRELGPWDERTEEVWIPPQYENRLGKLKPFQEVIWDSAKKFDDRHINLVYDPTGNRGKSTIAAVCELYAKGLDMPPINDAQQLIQSACSICYAKRERYPSPIFIDMPRAMGKDRLFGIYTAVEQLKKGKLFDLRYKYTVWWIASPQIWVFSNEPPDVDLLSRDRWLVWTIDSKDCFVPYVPEPKKRKVIATAEDYIQETHGLTIEQLERCA